MARGFLLKDNLTKDTLKKIAAIGLITIAAVTSPFFLHRIVMQYFQDKDGYLARKRARKLRELQRRKLIEIQELADGSIKVVLSHLGKNLVRQYQLEDMKTKKPKRWDGYWRLVIYDIPTKKRKASDAFREKMKKLGLFQLQKSIWVSPYDCLAEIEFLCGIFDIDMDKCVCYFKTSDIPKEGEIRRFFRL